MNKYAKLGDFLVRQGHKAEYATDQVGLVACGERGILLHDDTCSFMSSPEFCDDKETIIVTLKDSVLKIELEADFIKAYPTHKVFFVQDRICITNLDNEEIRSFDVLNITLNDVQ